MRKQAACVPHFSPLPDLSVILIGSFPFGTSYVMLLSSEFSEIFLFFDMFLLTAVNIQAIELMVREFCGFGWPLSS